MELFRYSKSIYGGQTQLIGASYDLLKWFVVAGLVFVVLHAVYKLATRKSGAPH